MKLSVPKMIKYTFIGLFFINTGIFSQEQPSSYNPEKKIKGVLVDYQDLIVFDKKRQRTLSIRIYISSQMNQKPVIIFSHGLGGSRTGNSFMGNHWAKHGYIVICVQHPGSDSAVWQKAAKGNRLNSLRNAANAKQFFNRVNDIPVVLNQLTLWNQLKEHSLSGRLDMNKVGMSGHSFGAITAQAVSGQQYWGEAIYTDPRIQAAIAFSPSSPKIGNAKMAFGNVSIPWMLMTGTEDIAPIGQVDLQSRLDVYKALPLNNKYELVLNMAQHSAFTDRALPTDTKERNPNHHRAILALSTAFWDAYLKGDSSAKKWLSSNKPKIILENMDSWQYK